MKKAEYFIMERDGLIITEGEIIKVDETEFGINGKYTLTDLRTGYSIGNAKTKKELKEKKEFFKQRLDNYIKEHEEDYQKLCEKYYDFTKDYNRKES